MQVAPCWGEEPYLLFFFVAVVAFFFAGAFLAAALRGAGAFASSFTSLVKFSSHALISRSVVVSTGVKSFVRLRALENEATVPPTKREMMLVDSWAYSVLLIFSLFHGSVNLLFSETEAGAACAGAAGLDESETPSMKRLVRESGRPVPRHVATSMTEPGLSLPSTIFCPSGRSITMGLSDAGIGIFEITGSLDACFFFTISAHPIFCKFQTNVGI